jgi:hypothetical protein
MIRRAFGEENTSHTRVFERNSCNSPRRKKTRQVKSKVKRILIILFDVKWIGNKEFVLTGQTVNSAYCCEVLWWLWKDAENSPWTLGTEELAIALLQCTILEFLFHHGIFAQKQHDCHPPPTLVAWLGSWRLFCRIMGGAEHPHRTQFSGSVQTWQKPWELRILTEGDYFEGDGGQ